MKKCIIGVSGGSGSGKSTLCKLIASQLPKTHLLSVDNHYKPILPTVVSPIDNKEYDDWNNPDGIDLRSVTDELDEARKSGADIIIIDGAFIYCIPEIRDLIDYKIYVDATIETRFFRRIKRNLYLNKPPDAVAADLEFIGVYYLHCARFSEERYSIPSKKYADCIINSEAGFDNKTLGDLYSKINDMLSNKNTET